jgi:hypothetical protein
MSDQGVFSLEQDCPLCEVRYILHSQGKKKVALLIGKSSGDKNLSGTSSIPVITSTRVSLLLA